MTRAVHGISGSVGQLGRVHRCRRRGGERRRIGVSQKLDRQVGDDGAADDQRRPLDQISPGAGFETARKDVDRGQRSDDPTPDRDAAEIQPEESLPLEVDGDHLGTRVDNRRGGDPDQNDQRRDGHDRAGERVVPILEKLGNGGDGRHPLVTRDGHPQPVRGLAAHTDELLGGDVGGDQAEADQPPRQTAAGEEVVLSALVAAGLLTAALPQSDTDDADHEDNENKNVDDAYTHGVLPFLAVTIIPSKATPGVGGGR